MPQSVRQANTTWETVMTVHATLLRNFGTEAVWRAQNLTMREYDVLYTLSKCGAPTRVGDLKEHVLLSQPGISRMIDRLATRGFLVKREDEADGRAVLIDLTPTGRAVQETVGRAHARSVTAAVNLALSDDEQRTLAALNQKLIDAHRGDNSAVNSPFRTAAEETK